MDIVIRIPKGKEERLIRQMKLDRNFKKCEIVELPKGHGRLIDADALEGHRQIQIVPCGNGKYTEITTYYQNDIDTAPTIVEADKAESEDKE